MSLCIGITQHSHQETASPQCGSSGSHAHLGCKRSIERSCRKKGRKKKKKHPIAIAPQFLTAVYPGKE